MQYLLTAEFRWLTQIDANTIHEHDADGFMLEVDLNYPG